MSTKFLGKAKIKESIIISCVGYSHSGLIVDDIFYDTVHSKQERDNIIKKLSKFNSVELSNMVLDLIDDFELENIFDYFGGDGKTWPILD